jgi:hypothetical protein
MQELIVFLIVGAAALYLVRMLWNTAQNQKGCGGCGGACGGKTAKPANSSLIQIQLNGQPLQMTKPTTGNAPSRSRDN